MRISDWSSDVCSSDLLEKALQARPEIVITDLSMPGINGIEVVRRLREALPETRVLVLTMHMEDAYVLQAVRAGASGYLRSEERRVGTECVSPCRSWCEPSNYTKKQKKAISRPR